jgi:hypothetical protein
MEVAGTYRKMEIESKIEGNVAENWNTISVVISGIWFVLKCVTLTVGSN